MYIGSHFIIAKTGFNHSYMWKKKERAWKNEQAAANLPRPIFHEEHITMGGQDLITWSYCLLDKTRRRSMGEKAAAASPPSSV